MMVDSSAYIRGKWAEEIALKYLLEKNYILIQQRYRTRDGEIDIILIKDHFLVMVEVRCRKYIRIAGESITKIKKLRLTQTTKKFMMQHPDLLKQHPFVRFDVVLVDQNAEILHIENAFEAQE